MQAVQSINKAKAVTVEKTFNDSSMIRTSILAKTKKYITTILFGDINSINVNSEKIRNYNNYKERVTTVESQTNRMRTLFR